MEPGNLMENSPIDVTILAGGLGTRLRGVVADRPKVLAEVAGQPFLRHLLTRLRSLPVRSVVLCVGHLARQVETTLGCLSGDMPLRYAREAEPLGTGGALRNALPLLETRNVLVMNGDSFCAADLPAFRHAHRASGAVASLVLTQVADCGRYGRVTCDDGGRVTTFAEKMPGSGPGWINAGIYLFARDAIAAIPADRAVSLEREVLVNHISAGLHGWPGGGRFIDIGTPESYAAADAFFLNAAEISSR
jgi:D-glycero-alpha-D-manno-heptose 1-phosphate guanylyltransferase